MNKSINIVVSFILFSGLISCSKEDPGISTILKGHVADTIRGINISGYKIVLVKGWPFCAGWSCGLKAEEIATTFTDSNGDYSITFNYKLNNEEYYNLEEQYYGFPYYLEHTSGTGKIIAGDVNTRDLYVWQPVVLQLTVEVLNNIYKPLTMGNKLADTNHFLFNTENVYELNSKKTYFLRTRPNTDIKIAFWYYTDPASRTDLHQKTVPYHSTFTDTTALNFIVDCSTF